MSIQIEYADAFVAGFIAGLRGERISREWVTCDAAYKDLCEGFGHGAHFVLQKGEPCQEHTQS